ncbi:porin family protein [Sphingomonas sp.]|uniref:outer membrane protein n=1 Tax=Sphingomonas sp. TaxID=28214 RepID=UPI002CD2AE6F|nr:porin family protein [Sphingomonas sp.]HWK36757.1 porin family protein [Sphingomonas sp.]
MRLIAASLLLSAFAAAPALAQDKPFEGPSATAIAGVDVSEHRAGLLYGGQIGYDWQTDSNLVFGVEGEATGSTSRDCVDGVSGSGGATRQCFKTGRDFYAGGRIGTVVGGSTLLYAKGGYTNARRSYEYSDSATPANDYQIAGNSDGFRVGAGVEKRIGDKMLVKAEYRYSNYDGGQDRHQGLVGLGFRF